MLLVVFAAYAFWESSEISGFTGLTTAGVMPMLASGVLVLTGLVILVEALRSPPAADSSTKGLVTYLFPLRVVLFTLLVALYVAVIPGVGFLPASGALIFIAVWALWRKGPFWSLAISLFSIAVIYLLFRVVFKVVLPMGSLWQ